MVFDPDGRDFERFCDKYDVPVMDRAYLAGIFESDGWAEALDAWRELRSENYALG